jgi:hypothetical protein
MQVSRALVLAALLSALLIAGAVPVLAQTDLDCEDFPSQALAQAVLETDPTDPHDLDGNGDGQACETFFGGDDGQPATDQPAPAPAPTPAPTPTTDDLDCRDFATQAEAQAHLDADLGDPDRLDQDADGQACEVFFGTGVDDRDAAPVVRTPRRIDTGAGGTAR